MTLPRFQLQIRADYPYWQAAEENAVTVSALNRAVAATIAGDVPALFRAKIHVASGTASGIAIRDEGSGETLTFDGTVAAGQELILQSTETGRVICTVDGSSAINGVTGGLRKLQPGAQRIGIYSSGSVTGSAEIMYREALSGV